MNKLVILSLFFLTSIVNALVGDLEQPLEIEASTVKLDENTGFHQFFGNFYNVSAEVRQGSLLLLADIIQVQTNDDGVDKVIATGSLDRPAKYTQSQENQDRLIEANATLITYDTNTGIIILKGNANLTQGFESFSGDSLEYDTNNDKVITKGSEDGTQRVKFKIEL